MKIIEITEKQIEEAKKLYEFDELNNSITKGKSNIFGALGEIIVRDYFIENKFKVNFTSTYDYDMIINNYKVDVKTKKTTVKPKVNYNCSISNSNIKQKTDYYFFVRITEDLKTGYLLGYILKK
jgi:predicted DNA-binding protein